MGRNVCNTCNVSAVCLAGGFYELYAKEFKKRLPSTYRITRVHHDLEPAEAHRIRIAVDNTAAQAAFAFPDRCPEKPHSIDPVLMEFEKDKHVIGNSMLTKFRVGTEIFEVRIG